MKIPPSRAGDLLKVSGALKRPVPIESLPGHVRIDTRSPTPEVPQTPLCPLVRVCFISVFLSYLCVNPVARVYTCASAEWGSVCVWGGRFGHLLITQICSLQLPHQHSALFFSPRPSPAVCCTLSEKCVFDHFTLTLKIYQASFFVLFYCTSPLLLSSTSCASRGCRMLLILMLVDFLQT